MSGWDQAVSTDAAGASIRVRLAPRASSAGVVGLHGGAVKVRVCAPPVDQRANDELLTVLAKALGVRPSSVELAGGARSRSKLVRVRGLEPHEVVARLT